MLQIYVCWSTKHGYWGHLCWYKFWVIMIWFLSKHILTCKWSAQQHNCQHHSSNVNTVVDYYEKQFTVNITLVPRATLRGVAELHVASGMPQWRMFVTCCYFLDENRVIPECRHFLKGHFPGWRVVHSIVHVFPLWRISYDLTQKIIHRPQ